MRLLSRALRPFRDGRWTGELSQESSLRPAERAGTAALAFALDRPSEVHRPSRPSLLGSEI